MKIVAPLEAPYAEEYFGKFFTKIPNRVLRAVFAAEERERRSGLLLLWVFHTCFRAWGEITFAGEVMRCGPGEKITTYRDISEATGISLGSVGRLLNALKEQGLIDIIRVPGGSKIRLLAYEPFGIPATKKQE